MQIRCPHCRNAVEFLDSSSVRQISCSSCGSNFSLIDDDTVTHARREKTLVGRFQLVEKLGVGAFGTVWKATDPELDRTVALKIPRKEQLSAQESEQFLREARAAAQLKHPSIVSVHEVGRDSDVLFIVSDFVDGLTLADWLTGQKPTSRTAAELCKQIADALHIAHEAGIIHRDLKPSNIMLDRANQPQIMDFGLAKRDAGEITMTVDGQIMGTPAYMSPEQARGDARTADRRTDIYSLGVIFFELLTGELPFRGNQRMLIHQILTEQPPQPRSLDSNVPRDLETICLKCLQKDAASRFATADELSNELDRFLNGEPIRSRPIGVPLRTWRWCKRYPAIASLIAAVLILLISIAVGGSLTSLWLLEKNRLILESQSAASGAKRDAQRRLVDSRIVESRMRRFSKQPGQRLETLEAIGEAAELAVNLQLPAERIVSLRNEAIAALGLHDIREVRRLQSKDSCFFAGFDPRREVYVNGDGDGDVRVFRLSNQAPVAVLPGFEERPSLVRGFSRVSPNGDLVAARIGNRLRVWNLKNRRPIPFENGPPETTQFFNNIIFDESGHRLAVGLNDGGVAVYDTDSSEIENQLTDTPPVSALAFFENGARIVVAGRGPNVLQVWDLTSATKTSEVSTPVGIESLSTVETTSGAFVAAGSVDNQILIWSLSDLERTPTTLVGHFSNELPLGNNIEVLFSPNGKWLATTSWGDGRTVLWDWRTGRQLVEGRGWCRQFSNDSSRLFFSTGYEIGEWEIVAPIEHSQLAGRGRSLSCSPDGRFLAIGGDNSVSLFRLPDRTKIATLETGPVGSVNFHPDGSLLVSGAAGLQQWLIEQETGFPAGEPQTILEFGSQYGNRPGRCDLSADGQVVAAVSRRSEISILQPSGEIAHKLEHTDAVNVAVSNDGKWAVTSCGPGSARGVLLWDLETGQLLRDLWPTCVDAKLEFSPDGKYLVGGSGKEYRFWDLASWKVVKKIAREGAEDISAPIAFSADSRLAAIATTRRELVIVEAASGSEMARFKTPPWTLRIESVIFSPDTSILTIGTSRTVEFWDLKRVRAELAGLKLDW